MDDTITISTTNLTDTPDYTGPFTIDMSSIDTSLYSGMNYTSTGGFNIGSSNNITISNGGSTYSMPYTSGAGVITSANPWASTTMGGQLELEGENADVKINGKSLADFMDKMEKRLAILVPDPEKLEHFAALKKAYENYKTLEALCELPKEEDGN